MCSPDTDTLIIDVTGAKADEPQTAQLKLWAPRTTKAEAKGRVGLLSQGWIDDLDPGASGRPFGSLSAITAEGRDVSVAVTDPLTVTVTFKPDADGHFRVIVASPHYDGKQDALTDRSSGSFRGDSRGAQILVARLLEPRSDSQDHIEGWIRRVHGESPEYLSFCRSG